MFGHNKNGIHAYSQVGLETGVLSASPNKLIIMLYEGAIKACKNAIDNMQSKDIPKKCTMISNAILIIESGLRLSLNKKAGGEIAERLDALYAYMSQRLMIANIQNKPEIINEVIQLLTDLKGAWEAISTTQEMKVEDSVVIPNQIAMAINSKISEYAKV